MGTIEIFVMVGYLIVYMYFGFNLLMMILEKRVKFSLVEICTAIEQLLNKDHNPKEYVQARIYFWGTFLMLAMGMILLSLAQRITSATKTPLRGSTRNKLLAFVAGVMFHGSTEQMQKFDDTLTKMALKLVRDIHADMKLKDNFTIREFLFVVQFHASQSPGGVLGVLFIAGVVSVGLIALAFKVFG